MDVIGKSEDPVQARVGNKLFRFGIDVLEFRFYFTVVEVVS